MPALIQAIRAARKVIVRALQPYRVHVLGRDFDGTVHNAWTYSDALAWARCYGFSHCLEVHIRTRHGRFVGRVW